ncbi:MAG: ubiquinol-cytochrome C reductase [Proteobacteria bacterium]|nr:ubiquinol-cytochrome C reductase [Pseudomonadota bacterium]
MLERLFRTRPAVIAGRALYEGVVAQARDPGLYAELGVPDTVEGRFEAYSLHVVLLLDRLRADDAKGRDDIREVSQALFDTYVKSLDHALREMGVGDLSVGKKMRKLGEAFYGRCKSYETAFSALPDQAPLVALLARTAYAGVENPPAARLAAYVLAERAALAAQPLETLAAGEVSWKAP